MFTFKEGVPVTSAECDVGRVDTQTCHGIAVNTCKKYYSRPSFSAWYRLLSRDLPTQHLEVEEVRFTIKNLELVSDGSESGRPDV